MFRPFQCVWLWALLLSGSALAVPFPADSKLRLGLSLYGNAAQSTEAESRIAGTEIEASLSHSLFRDLSFQLTGGVQLETGAARSRWAQDFQPRQVQRLREAQVIYSPIPEIKLIAGAIDQQRWQSPLLLQRQSFPGIFQGFEKRFGRFSIALQAEQAIASDTSSLQPWGQWQQGMPGFFIERLGLGYAPSEDLSVSFLGSHYLFQNLQAPSALQSQFFGNTVIGSGPADARYVFPFQGYELGAQIKGRIGSVKPEFQASYMRNSRAPRGRSDGWRMTLQTPWEASPHFKLVPRFEFFRMESDVVPGFYNDRVFGHNNRNGFGASLGAEWPASGVQAVARWIHSDVIAAHPYQSKLDWVQFQLSTQYDLL